MGRVLRTAWLAAAVAPLGACGGPTTERPATTADAPSRRLGLLTLPSVFGSQPCDTATPVPVPLFERQGDARPIGAIEVATRVQLEPEGGCRAPTIVFRRGDATLPLLTQEIGYEIPAVAVVAVGPSNWYRVRLDDTSSAWVQRRDPGEYRDLAALLTGAMTFTTAAWDGALAASPGSAPAPARDSSAGRADQPVAVVEVQSVAGQLWARVEIMSHSVCGGDGDPTVVRSGWLPLHDRRGEPTVWFASRGC